MTTPTDDEVLSRLRATLTDAADEDLRATSGRVFKEEIRPYGIRVATVRSIATRALADLGPVDLDRLWRLCDDMWASGWLEESFVACYWAAAQAKRFRPSEVEVFGRWLGTGVSNWASCDALCTDSIGRLLLRYPQVAPTVVSWASSSNRWLRRGAAVSFIRPARKGEFLDTVFQVAETLLTDQDDLVRKGYGWLLKAARRPHPDQVYDYLLARRDVMPRVAFRYALEHYDRERRDAAMGRATGRSATTAP
ncbi:DNA alkylation repair protein [Cellulomonas denverensis]|uniref:DNA alkylation repair protein n=1 Tax=Cellulomonas denverensis TaxID=264297 RepID=UPI0035EEF4C1